MERRVLQGEEVETMLPPAHLNSRSEIQMEPLVPLLSICTLCERTNILPEDMYIWCSICNNRFSCFSCGTFENYIRFDPFVNPSPYILLSPEQRNRVVFRANRIWKTRDGLPTCLRCVPMSGATKAIEEYKNIYYKACMLQQINDQKQKKA